jgi:hypothetical protein
LSAYTIPPDGPTNNQANSNSSNPLIFIVLGSVLGLLFIGASIVLLVGRWNYNRERGRKSLGLSMDPPKIVFSRRE